MTCTLDTCWVCTHTCINEYLHAYMHASLQTYTSVCVCLHACKYSHILSLLPPSQREIFSITQINSPSLSLPLPDRLVGLVVEATALRAEDPGFESHLRQEFSGVKSCQIGTPVATLPGAWHYRVSAGTGRPHVSLLCDWVRWKVWFATYISVWQHIKLSKQICPWDTLACCCDVK